MNLINHDYRTTEFSKFDDIVAKKCIFEEYLKKSFPKNKNIYNKINRKNGCFKDFAKIYNFKCAYCGVSAEVINIQLFEVDHYICKKSCLPIVDTLSNLVLSCKTCNQWKKDFLIKESYRDILNPDDKSISKVFFRDEEFYIQIKQKYINDTEINDFYNKLGLGSEFRRIDYLLMKMKEIIDKYDNIEMLKCYLFLIEKRNFVVPTR